MSNRENEDKIFIHGIGFYGHLGFSQEEKIVGGRYSVDVQMIYSLEKAAESDSLSDTVDYSSVYDLVKEMGESESCDLIEHLAGKMVEAILSKYPVHEVTLILRKLTPPISGPLDYVGVEITRKKEDQGS